MTALRDGSQEMGCLRIKNKQGITGIIYAIARVKSSECVSLRIPNHQQSFQQGWKLLQSFK